MSRCFPHRPNTLQDSRPLAAGCKSALPRARRILRQKMNSLGGFLASDFGPRNRPLWGRTEPGRLALSAEAACHGDGRTRTISVTCGACGAAAVRRGAACGAARRGSAVLPRGALRCCSAPRCVRPSRVSSPCCRASYTATWRPCRKPRAVLHRKLRTSTVRNALHSYTAFGNNAVRFSVWGGGSPWGLVCGHRGDNGGPGRPCGDLCGGVRFLGRFTHLSGRFADSKKIGGFMCHTCAARTNANGTPETRAKYGIVRLASSF